MREIERILALPLEFVKGNKMFLFVVFGLFFCFFFKGVGTIHVRNMGFLGWPDSNKELLIDRIYNCTKDPMSHLTKPVNIVEGTLSLEMHSPTAKEGYVQVGRSNFHMYNLYMAHYWGARIFGFKGTLDDYDGDLFIYFFKV